MGVDIWEVDILGVDIWEVDILGVDISGVDILGVDILRVDILGGTPTKKASRFWGCGQFLPSLLSAYWVLSTYFLAVLEISGRPS